MTHPEGTRVVGCRWVFTVKHKTDGSVERYKVRLVARDFTQIYSVDYAKTFSPVARLNSIWVLLSLAINQSWSLHQLDVKNAFLYGDLSEQVYTEQPLGFVTQSVYFERQYMDSSRVLEHSFRNLAKWCWAMVSDNALLIIQFSSSQVLQAMCFS